MSRETAPASPMGDEPATMGLRCRRARVSRAARAVSYESDRRIVGEENGRHDEVVEVQQLGRLAVRRRERRQAARWRRRLPRTVSDTQDAHRRKTSRAGSHARRGLKAGVDLPGVLAIRTRYEEIARRRVALEVCEALPVRGAVAGPVPSMSTRADPFGRMTANPEGSGQRPLASAQPVRTSKCPPSGDAARQSDAARIAGELA